MLNLIRTITLAACLLTSIASNLAIAQQDPCAQAVQDFLTGLGGATGENVYAGLNNQRNVGCVLGPTDTSGIEERYQTLQNKALSATERAVARTQLFSLSIQQFASIPSSNCTDRNLIGCMVGRHINSIRALQNELVSSATNPSADIMNNSQWAIVADTGFIAVSDIHVKEFLKQECATDIADVQCHTAISLSASFMRTSIAMIQVIAAFNQPMIEANAEFLSQRDMEWEQYFNVVSVQFPWELSVNSLRFTRRNKDTLDNFPRAPNSKFILLHPSLGFENIETPLGDTSTHAAVFLELFGYEQWRWRNGKASNRWGLSVTASYANIPGMDEIGYGFLVHTPIRNIAFGATYRDGDAGREIGIVMNIKLSKFLQQFENIDLSDFLTP